MRYDFQAVQGWAGDGGLPDAEPDRQGLAG